MVQKLFLKKFHKKFWKNYLEKGRSLETENLKNEKRAWKIVISCFKKVSLSKGKKVKIFHVSQTYSEPLISKKLEQNTCLLNQALCIWWQKKKIKKNFIWNFKKKFSKRVDVWRLKCFYVKKKIAISHNLLWKSFARQRKKSLIFQTSLKLLKLMNY